MSHLCAAIYGTPHVLLSMGHPCYYLWDIHVLLSMGHHSAAIYGETLCCYLWDIHVCHLLDTTVLPYMGHTCAVIYETLLMSIRQ